MCETLREEALHILTISQQHGPFAVSMVHLAKLASLSHV